MRIQFVVPAVALLFAGVACNAVLDIEEFPPGATGEAGVDGSDFDSTSQSGDATASTSDAQDGGGATDTLDVTSDAPTDSPADALIADAAPDIDAEAQCSPVAARCLDNTPQSCGVDDQWHSAPSGACVGSEPFCVQGTCVVCIPDPTPTQCASDGTPQFCGANGQWQNVAGGACSGSTPLCLNGVCSGCTGEPDGTRCGEGLACEGGACTCNAASCPTGCCVGGACLSKPTWYQDADGDGFGNRSVSMASCAQPTGFVSDSTDCCDTDPLANPGFFANHSSNPWQITPDACGNFLWNCETSGVPIMQYTNLSLCTATYCIGSCPSGCIGYTASNPACGQMFIQETVMCEQSGTCMAVSVTSNDSLQQGCY